jgi:hypothetical protein
MSQKQKLVERLKAKPKDFTWDELENVLKSFGYQIESGSGSRRKFFNAKTGDDINLHQPHPKNILKSYQIRDVLTHLKEKGLL